MSDPQVHRRAFLRLASLGTLGAAAACAGARPAAGPKTTVFTESPSPTPAGTAPSPVSGGVAWKQLTASGPKARNHHTFTANDQGSIAFLFGGRAAGVPLADLWALDRTSNSWSKIDAAGPPARFGHSAAFADGHLVIFGGQAAGGRFFNDTWAFDSLHGSWVKLSPTGGPPAPRYGASGATIGTALTISHGFATPGRFEDTWALSSAWVDVTPTVGPVPVKRCLHRAVYLPGLGRMLLFGGQTDGTPFLGDTWLYDPATRQWSEIKRTGPSPRNLYALAGTKDRAYLFGGAAPSGSLADLWSFEGTGWKALSPAGAHPPARGATQGAIVTGPSMLVFGGTDGPNDLADLWELTLPA